MASTGTPETPRQKMIMLMYLVLTAMLALNVDKKVLDAFASVNGGFMSTIENFGAKNEGVYTQFNNAAQENPKKVGELNRTVIRIKQHTDSIYNYIAALKEQIVKNADGPEGNVNNIQSKENLNVAAELMVTLGNGTKLKHAIGVYRDSLLKVFDPKDTAQLASIRMSLDTSDPPAAEGGRPSWVVSKFEGFPLIAVITLMSKLQSDIRNSEFDAINYLHAKIDESSFKFNKLKAVVIPKTDYVLKGGSYEAKVFLSAIDTTAVPDILVGGRKLEIKAGENAGTYTASGNAEGDFNWKGFINFKNPNGILTQYPFEATYQVAEPTATISASRMNVLYLGIQNPISISVPGISSRDLTLSIKNGVITKNDKGYFAKPDHDGENAYITVSATIDKAVIKMKTVEFRVKTVPDPIATVANKYTGKIPKNDLMVQQGVFADMPKDFDFDMKFQVLSFTVISEKSGGLTNVNRSNGPRFTNDQRTAFEAMIPGNQLIIKDIEVKGDDGKTRTINPIVLTIN